jgi:hypothetical protein
MHGGVEPLKLLFYKLDLKEFQSSVPEIKTIFSESLGKQSINKGKPIFIWSVLFFLDLQVFAASKWFCIWNCRLNYSIANISIVDYARMLETRQY